MRKLLDKYYKLLTEQPDIDQKLKPQPYIGGAPKATGLSFTAEPCDGSYIQPPCSAGPTGTINFIGTNTIGGQTPAVGMSLLDINCTQSSYPHLCVISVQPPTSPIYSDFSPGGPCPCTNPCPSSLLSPVCNPNNYINVLPPSFSFGQGLNLPGACRACGLGAYTGAVPPAIPNTVPPSTPSPNPNFATLGDVCSCIDANNCC